MLKQKSFVYKGYSGAHHDLMTEWESSVETIILNINNT